MNINLDEILPININDISPEDLMDILGLSNLTIDELLKLLKDGALEIKEAWRIKLYYTEPDGKKKFYELGKKYSPVAFKIYDLLRKGNKEPRMPIFLISNRLMLGRYYPDTVSFWDNTDIIYGLFKSLKEDGYYASS